MKIYRIAASPDSNERKVKSLEKDNKDQDKEIKALKRDLKKLQTTIDKLNIGNRRFWQQQTIFTSLQRKIERFERVEGEWKKFKEQMEKKMKSFVEKSSRPQAKL
jgi:TolA-binding protein